MSFHARNTTEDIILYKMGPDFSLLIAVSELQLVKNFIFNVKYLN